MISNNNEEFWDFIISWCATIKRKTNLFKYLEYKHKWRTSRIKMYRRMYNLKLIKNSDCEEEL